jgi:hypothetical protein
MRWRVESRYGRRQTSMLMPEGTLGAEVEIPESQKSWQRLL